MRGDLYGLRCLVYIVFSKMGEEDDFFPTSKKILLNCMTSIRTCGKEYVTKTCLYNFDPLKPNFFIVKLGFTMVYIIFLISA